MKNGVDSRVRGIGTGDGHGLGLGLGTERRRREGAGIRADQGGAMLLVGIFVSLALTASLWFMIGIGDAIAFREMAQEATDAGSFSSAVVHARGMNFIAAVNLVMFGVTVVYLILAIIADLFTVALATCVGPAYTPCSYGTSGSVPATLELGRDTFKQAADRWRDSVVKNVIKSGHQLQKVVAIGAPWAGSFAANRVAVRYDKDLVASTIGLSHVKSIEGSNNAVNNNTGRLGLPVKAVKASTLCDRAFSSFGIGQWTQKNSGQNFDMGFEPLKQAVSEAAKSATTAIHCSDDFWKDDGPKIVIEKAQNGSDYMQVFGFMIGAKLKDKTQSDKGVGILAKMKNEYSEKPPRSNVYLSQAEFYFDCASSWETEACNDKDNAMYSPMWKVRLRRMRPPVAAAELAGMAGSLLTMGAAAVGLQNVGIPSMDDAVKRMGDAAKAEIGSVLSQQMKAFFNSPSLGISIPNVNFGNFGNLGDAARNAAQNAANEAKEQATNAAKDAANDAKKQAADAAKNAARDYLKDATKNLQMPGYYH